MAMVMLQVAVNEQQRRTVLPPTRPAAHSKTVRLDLRLVPGRWFDHVAAHLPDEIRVVAPGLRGFGGTRLDGTPVAEDYAGTGSGGVNPDFSRRLG